MVCNINLHAYIFLIVTAQVLDLEHHVKKRKKKKNQKDKRYGGSGDRSLAHNAEVMILLVLFLLQMRMSVHTYLLRYSYISKAVYRSLPLDIREN